MYYLKNLYLTEEMMSGEKDIEFKNEMEDSFDVNIVPSDLNAFREYV